MIIIHIWALFKTSFPLYSVNDIFYFYFWILYCLFIVNNIDFINEFIEKEQKYIVLIMKLWTLSVGISLLLPSSYINEPNMGGRYFTSFTTTSFRLGPTAVFIMILAITAMVFFKNRNYLYYCILPLFCFFMGSSRTYLGIGVLLFMIAWYIYCPRKSTFYLTIVPIIIMGVSFLSVSAMQNKIESTQYTASSYQDFWGTITSSRSVFWEADIKAYLEQNFVSKLLGNGFNFVYDINKESVGVLIWAHNDFIQLLTTFGIVGLAIYIWSVYVLFKTFIKRSINVPNNIKYMVFGTWLINAFFNMVYTYFCSAISLPILFIAINYAYKNRLQYIHEKRNGDEKSNNNNVYL